jgi:hypothetical protein
MKFNVFSGRIMPVLVAGLLCGFNSAQAKSYSCQSPNYYFEVQNRSTDSVQIRKSVYDFLQWYKKNIRKANSFGMIDYDTKGLAYVKTKACQDYLSFIKTSKQVSSKYIGYWKKYFEDEAQKIKKDKLTKDDVPEGFDFDFVLITQEPEIILDSIGKLDFKLVSLNSKNAVMEISLPGNEYIKYEFEMQRTPNGWMIDYISTANFD